jgi:hypothetical protein
MAIDVNSAESFLISHSSLSADALSAFLMVLLKHQILQYHPSAWMQE